MITQLNDPATDTSNLLHAVLAKAGFDAGDSHEQLVAAAQSFLAAPKPKVLATLNDGGILEVSISDADARSVDVQTLDSQDGEAGSKYSFDSSWLPLLNPYFDNDLPEWVRIKDVPTVSAPAGEHSEAADVEQSTRCATLTMVDARYGSTSLPVTLHESAGGAGGRIWITGERLTENGFDLRSSSLAVIRSMVIAFASPHLDYSFPDGWTEEDVMRSLPLESWMPVLNKLVLTKPLQAISDASFERQFLKDAHKRLEETYGVTVASSDDDDTLLGGYRSGLEAADAVEKFAQQRELTPLVPLAETIRNNQSRMRG